MEVLKKLDWVGRDSATQRRNSKKDVSISVTTNKGRPAISLIFRNDMHQLLSETDFIQFAIMKNRIFFQGSNAEEGLLMYQASDHNNNRYLKLSRAEIVEKLKEFEGDYSIEYDEFYELYYIEK